MHPWLLALRHDLVKRAVWPARDLRDTGGRDRAALRRGLTQLTDAEGAPVTVKGELLGAVPPGVVTVIGPVVAVGFLARRFFRWE